MTSSLDIEWFRSQLSVARAHTDDAIGSRDEAATRANIAAAWEVCKAITAALYSARLAPGERGTIEADLSALRSHLQSLEARSPT